MAKSETRYSLSVTHESDASRNCEFDSMAFSELLRELPTDDLRVSVMQARDKMDSEEGAGGRRMGIAAMLADGDKVRCLVTRVESASR